MYGQKGNYIIHNIFDLNPVQNANPHPNQLHGPHAQPEPQGATQPRQKGGDGELRDVGLSHLDLLLQ